MRAKANAENRKWQRTAQLGAWTLSPWSKRPVSADDLIKPPKQMKRVELASPDHVTEIVHKLAGAKEIGTWQPSQI
jgi:hypothetical protein